MELRPTKIERAGADRLRIAWSDGQVREYTPRELREHCRCASCRQAQTSPPPPPTQLTVLSPAEAQPLRITAMTPVGNYAYQITFSDGHATGIYELGLLRGLGRPIT